MVLRDPDGHICNPIMDFVGCGGDLYPLQINYACEQAFLKYKTGNASSEVYSTSSRAGGDVAGRNPSAAVKSLGDDQELISRILFVLGDGTGCSANGKQWVFLGLGHCFQDWLVGIRSIILGDQWHSSIVGIDVSRCTRSPCSLDKVGLASNA